MGPNICEMCGFNITENAECLIVIHNVSLAYILNRQRTGVSETLPSILQLIAAIQTRAAFWHLPLRIKIP